jgi:hypothetical protein
MLAVRFERNPIKPSAECFAFKAKGAAFGDQMPGRFINRRAFRY